MIKPPDLILLEKIPNIKEEKFNQYFFWGLYFLDLPISI